MVSPESALAGRGAVDFWGSGGAATVVGISTVGAGSGDITPWIA
jgi:hypothetical protein